MAEWPEVGYTVGVFRLEGRGVQLFDRIEGDYFTILGMPLLPLLGALRERGLLSPHDPARAHRVDRHGQVDGRANVRARRRAGVRCGRGGARAAGPMGAGLVGAIGERFPGVA